jgi:hypothetical protein
MERGPWRLLTGQWGKERKGV